MFVGRGLGFSSYVLHLKDVVVQIWVDSILIRMLMVAPKLRVLERLQSGVCSVCSKDCVASICSNPMGGKKGGVSLQI